jgi:cell division protein FtsQ
MTRKQKIFNLSIMSILFGLLAYFTITLKKSDSIKVEIILLEGNIHLSKEQYFEFANLLDKSQYPNITIQVIQDRIQKHPYVAKTDVIYDGSGKVSVRILEKEFESIVLFNNAQYLLTEDLQLIPLLSQTRKIDYPFISNPLLEKAEPKKFYRNNYDLVTAAKIISTVKLINPELYDALNVVDMQIGDDITLYFSILNYPVIIGRGSEVRKTIYFNNLWTYLKGKEINNIMEYVDLRYSGHVYLGIQETSTEGNKKS